MPGGLRAIQGEGILPGGGELLPGSALLSNRQIHCELGSWLRVPPFRASSSQKLFGTLLRTWVLVIPVISTL